MKLKKEIGKRKLFS